MKRFPLLKAHKSALWPQAADTAVAESDDAINVVDVAVDTAEFPEHANPHLKIAVVLDASSLHAQWQSATGRAVQGSVRRGTSSVMPADMVYKTRWQGAGRMLLLSFSPDFLKAWDAATRAGSTELRPAWSQPDPFLAQLGLSVLHAQRSGVASRTYMDAVAEVTMVHLLHRYGAAPALPMAQPLSSGLARVLDLIETHLDEDLSHAMLAAAAGQSVYGFARSFAKTMGEPPHRYVMRRRVERAKQLLAHTDTPLADLAATLGFSSQAHLTTAFLRATGTTPARFRNVSRS